MNTWNRTGYFYVRVTGRGGAFDTSSPFTLSVTKGIDDLHGRHRHGADAATGGARRPA